MEIFRVRNASAALPLIVQKLLEHGEYIDSRNGKTITFPTPAMTIYECPSEKVLYSDVRDANPFFHLMEAVWMLHGENDAAFLNYYVRDFGLRFGDQGIIHGAYGHRWVHGFGFNQIKSVINRLKQNPLDRQAVIQMWDSNSENFNDLNGDVLDRPCNTQIYFRVRDNSLEMTTTARSHDCVWGATGANAVHFPVLQEYIAGMLGIRVGKFYQFSNNYHMYERVFIDLLNRCIKQQGYGAMHMPISLIIREGLSDVRDIRPEPLISDPETFDEELTKTLKKIRFWHENGYDDNPLVLRNDFLQKTVLPMAGAHFIFKQKNIEEAIKLTDQVKSEDWRTAAKEWLLRRVK